MRTDEVEPEDEIQDDAVIGRALKGSLAILLCVSAVVGASLAVYFLLKDKPTVERASELSLPTKRAFDARALPKIPLVDTTEQAGIDWNHASGMEGEKLLPETMGGGVAIFDFDNDSDLDILFVGGKSWAWSVTPIAQPRSLCLYKNDGTGRFVDATIESGLGQTLYAMSPVIGDFDNDGWSDLFVTAVGRNWLFRNEQGVFRELTQQAGVAGEETDWSTGATFFDFDRDGWLDLFVCNYVLWNRELDRSLGFSLTGIGRAYGQPTSFTGTYCQLYRNQGNGTFADVSAEMGVQVRNPDTDVPVGKALAVAAVDLNRDGWTDIVVANDTVQNFCFINETGKSLTESAIAMGLAFDRSGNATGAMGIDSAYFRNDPLLALAIGNFANEPSSFYVSRSPNAAFDDLGMATGLGPVSRLNLTFGMFFTDLDLDSRQDIVCSNGHLEAEIATVQATQQYAQPPQFFWNAGASSESEFIALTEAEIGPAATQRMVGRGAAYGDLDADGDIDIVLVANSGRPRLLRNDQALGHHWLRLKLVGSGRSNLNAYGAIVRLQLPGSTQQREVTATRSYLSQSESIVTFGLGNASDIQKLTIVWPDGMQQELKNLSIDQLHVVTQGPSAD